MSALNVHFTLPLQHRVDHGTSDCTSLSSRSTKGLSLPLTRSLSLAVEIMVKASSRKQSAIVAGRPRRSPKNTLAAKVPRTIKHQTASVTSRLPVSETLLGMSEQEGREIAVAIAANLTSEGVSAFVCRCTSLLFR